MRITLKAVLLLLTFVFGASVSSSLEYEKEKVIYNERYQKWLDGNSYGKLFHVMNKKSELDLIKNNDKDFNNKNTLYLYGGYYIDLVNGTLPDGVERLVSERLVLEPLVSSEAHIIIQMHAQLFYKFLGIVGDEKAELHIVFADSEYCFPALYKNIIYLEKGIMQVKRELFKDRPEISCMLDFDFIIKKEIENKIALSEINKSIIKPVESSFKRASNSWKKILDSYKEKNAEVINVSHDGNYFGVTIKNIKSEIIKSNQYWEIIQIRLFLLDVDGVVSAHMILDGKYASGLSSPGEGFFRDMEPEHTGSMLEYGNKLISYFKHGE